MSIKKELDMLAEYTNGFGLNIGCGDQAIGTAIGMDVEPTAKAAVIIAPAEKVPFKNDTLDFIVACNSFEHIQQAPILTLREWCRCLKLGCPCAIVVPDAKYGDWAMTGDHGAVGRLQKPRPEMEHYHAFDTITLEQLFTFAGFKITKCEVIDRRPDRPEQTIICGGIKCGSFIE